MTYSEYSKVFRQLEAKTVKKNKFIKFNQPKKRSCGRALRRCRNCRRIRGHLNKYGLDLCRQCFREMALQIGFKKYG